MIQLILGDALNHLKNMESSSVHLCITDPPYFIDGLGDDWNKSKVDNSISKAGVIGGLPVGMKFDPEQGKKFQQFMEEISSEIFRVLMPGSYYICFSQARLYHRLGIAIENCGFEIRDMMAWTYEGQAKAFSQDHFVKKMKISDDQKEKIIKSLGGRKTPQLKPMLEPMVLAQKPKEGTFVDNWITYETGLINTSVSLDGKFPGNLMDVKKPTVKDKGEFNDHPTVKPVPLIEHLIKIFSKEGQILLDPFMGSGSHGVAAVNTDRDFIGIERDSHYHSISEKRIVSKNNIEDFFTFE